MCIVYARSVIAAPTPNNPAARLNTKLIRPSARPVAPLEFELDPAADAEALAAEPVAERDAAADELKERRQKRIQ